MSAVAYFHRRTGIAFVCDSDYIERLQVRLGEALGPRFVTHEWEVVSSFGGALRIKALAPGHLDISTAFDPEVF